MGKCFQMSLPKNDENYHTRLIKTHECTCMNQHGLRIKLRLTLVMSPKSLRLGLNYLSGLYPVKILTLFSMNKISTDHIFRV